jgi:hypothetical protein
MAGEALCLYAFLKEVNATPFPASNLSIDFEISYYLPISIYVFFYVASFSEVLHIGYYLQLEKCR